MRLTMLVEWSLGSLDRFDWDGETLIPRDPPWRPEWGVPPVNYGCIPGYTNPADGGLLDGIWCGLEPVEPGAWMEGEVLGMVWVADLDHKILLGGPGGLDRLDRAGLGRWFEGRDARIASAAEAEAFVGSLPRG